MVVVALVVAAALGYAFLPQPVEVDLAAVERGPMRVTVDEEGRTRVRERFTVSAPISGRLGRIALHAGDAVEAGVTVLSTIEPTNPVLLDVRSRAEAEAKVSAARASLNRAEAVLARARTSLEFAQRHRERIRKAGEGSAATREELDSAEVAELVASRELDAADFGRIVAQFELEQAQAALVSATAEQGSEARTAGFEIRSPITGRVLRILQESAAVVTPGTPLIELGDPGDLEIVVDVLSTDAVRVVPGAPVAIERWGGDEPLPGIVRRVEPSGFTKISALGVEEQRVNIIVDFAWRVPGSSGGSSTSRSSLLDEGATTRDLERAASSLGDGYRIEARISIWDEPDVVKVPASALFRRGSEWCVFAVAGDRAALREVRIGRQNDREAQVIDGLAPGETVIIHPGDRVRDGGRVSRRSNA